MLLSPQAFFSQPTAVPSVGLLFKLHIPAPSPRAHQQTPISGWGTHGCGMNHLCRSHSILPATDQLLGSPPSPQNSPSVPADLPLVRGFPQMREPPYLQLPTRSVGPILLPLLFLFPSSFFPPTWLHGDLSCSFRCSKLSASI